VAGSCEYGDEPSGSGATELVINCKHPFSPSRVFTRRQADRLSEGNRHTVCKFQLRIPQNIFTR
jgi:hypothetical protein